MKAIVVTDEAAGTAGMTLVERPEPPVAINDVVVQVHASGFVPTEMAWPSTWADRVNRDRTPSIPGHELAGVVTALGYGTTSEIVRRVRDGRLRTNIGDVATLDDAVAALNPTERRNGKTIIRVRP
jgi:NADPH:quinone reductase-like Zn-dependent oxidoreductase